MPEQLIPPELLKKSEKILIITHLALGDFTYMQNYFKELAIKYPNLKIDLWVDEGRGKALWQRWGKESRYILYDWLEDCSYFNKIYKNTASWRGLKSFLKQAKQESYPIVVSFASLRSYRYAKYARLISPQGFIAGIVTSTKKVNFIKNYRYRKLNKVFDFNVVDKRGGYHITDLYAAWFEKIFGLNIEKRDSTPFVAIPKKWMEYARLKFLKWGIREVGNRHQRVIFINAFAKNKRRCWPMDKVFRLISILQKENAFYDARFIVNVMPAQIKYFQNRLKNFSSQNIFLFTVDYNFFQLPSILSLCDLIISVETCVIHFAPALNVPVVALMRQKNPEWIPYGFGHEVICTRNRRDWVKDICVDDVARVVKNNSIIS